MTAVDFGRFMALAGMMIVHLSLEQQLPSLSDLIAGGRSAALFAFLAGVSLALVRRKSPEGSGSSRSIAIRAALIFVVGLILGSMSEVGAWVILPFYGIMFLLAIPLSRLSARTLLWLTGAWAVVAPFLSFMIRAASPFQASSQVEFSDVASPWSLLAELVIYGPYPVITWITFLMAGLAVGKMRLNSGIVAARLSWTGAALVAFTFLLGYIFMVTGVVAGWIQSPAWLTLFVHAAWIPTDSVANLALLGTHTNTPLNIISSVGSSLLLFGLCLLLTSAHPALPKILRPFSRAGQMTLTLYTAHLLLLWIAKNWGFTFAGGSYSEWGIQLLIFVVFATAWLSRFKRGPLESLVYILSVQNSEKQADPVDEFPVTVDARR